MTSLGVGRALVWVAWVLALLPANAAVAQAPVSLPESQSVDPAHLFTLLDQGHPRLVFADGDVRVPLRLRNDGAATWSHDDLYRIAYVWLDTAEHPIKGIEHSRRSLLPHSVHPGETVALDASLRTLSKPGVYRLRWDVVQEGVTWFAAVDKSPPPSTLVVVLPSVANLLLFGPIAVIMLAILGGAFRRARGRPPATAPWAPWAPRSRAPLGRRRSTWCLVLIGVVSVVAATWIQSGRARPTVFGDEALYTYKARNFATHGSYFAPPGAPDSLHLSAPFYSALLAPIFVATPDPDDAFRWILLLNALLHVSMIYPAWRIAQTEFPERRWLVVVAIAVWTVPGSYSLSIMSEALFVPLFLWTGYLYGRAVARPGRLRFTLVGAATALLLLTRFSGVAMLGVLGLVCAISWQGGRLGFARGRALLERLPMIALPAACWAGLRWTRARHEPEALHSVYNYAAKSLVTVDGRLGVLDFIRVWAGEIAYLNLATFNLLTLLLLVMGLAAVNGLRRRGSSTVPAVPPVRKGTGLMPLNVFFGLASLALLTTATVYMFTHLHTGKPRYAMYGRYADMVVPIIVIYALGASSPALRPRWSWRWTLGAVGGLLLTGGLFWLVPEVGDTRIINMGAAWYGHLLTAHEMSWWLVAVPCACLLVVLVASRGHRIRVMVVIAVLVLVNLHNTRLVEASHRYYWQEDAPTWRALESIQNDGGRVLYHDLLDVPRLLCSAQYLLYDRVELYVEGQPVDPVRDHFVSPKGLVPAGIYLARGPEGRAWSRPARRAARARGLQP